MNKILLLATFVNQEDLDSTYQFLDLKHKISKDKIFVFKNIENSSQYILTFKVVLKNNEKIDLKREFPNSIIVHKKGNALYTINALNKLIESSESVDIGNINYKSVKINWSDYQNKLLLADKEKLIIYNIEKVF